MWSSSCGNQGFFGFFGLSLSSQSQRKVKQGSETHFSRANPEYGPHSDYNAALKDERKRQHKSSPILP